MGDEQDGRRFEPALKVADLAAHRDAQLRVEIAQRFVHQDDRAVRHDAARERDALLLAARQLRRAAFGERAEADQRQHSVTRACDRCLSRPSRARSGQATFWNTVICGQIAYDWNTMTTLRRSTGTQMPRPVLIDDAAVDRDAAAFGCSSPAMQRSVVVLPQPLAPSSTEICALREVSPIERSRDGNVAERLSSPVTSIGIS